MKTLISCEYNMDTACVEQKYTNGTMLSVGTIAVENDEKFTKKGATTVAKRSFAASFCQAFSAQCYRKPKDRDTHCTGGLRRYELHILRFCASAKVHVFRRSSSPYKNPVFARTPG